MSERIGLIMNWIIKNDDIWDQVNWNLKWTVGIKTKKELSMVSHIQKQWKGTNLSDATKRK